MPADAPPCTPTTPLSCCCATLTNVDHAHLYCAALLWLLQQQEPPARIPRPTSAKGSRRRHGHGMTSHFYNTLATKQYYKCLPLDKEQATTLSPFRN